MTEPPTKRVLDPTKMRPATQEDLDRIYGPHGPLFYSPVRPRRTSTDERGVVEQPPKPEDAEGGTHE